MEWGSHGLGELKGWCVSDAKLVDWLIDFGLWYFPIYGASYFRSFSVELCEFKMWNGKVKKSRFEPIPSEDEHSQCLLPSETPLVIQRGVSKWVFVLSITLASLLSALLGAAVNSAARLDPNRISIRHTSQYCEDSTNGTPSRFPG